MDGARAIWVMFAQIYGVILDGFLAVWPDVKYVLTTLTLIYIQLVKGLSLVFLTPLVVFVSLLGVPVWLLEQTVALADFALARLQ